MPPTMPPLARPALTGTQGIFAQKRKGKSHTAQTQAEDWLEEKMQIAVIDPTGAWWGLRSSASGTAPGYPITIFGGAHADAPLELKAGGLIAEALVAQRFSAVLDLSLLDPEEWPVVAGDFLDTLYSLNRTAMHVFIDEADQFAPRIPDTKEQHRSRRVVNRLVRLGGIKGIGCTMITQRTAVLDTSIREQCDTIVALQMNGTRDLDALRKWLANHASRELVDEVIGSLGSLPRGRAWVLSPATETFELQAVRAKRTFDSGRTPEPGEILTPPKELAPVDIARLGKTIAATVEKARANDPAALKARVAQLEAELAKRAPAVTIEQVAVEVPIIDKESLNNLRAGIHLLGTYNSELDRIRDRMAQAQQTVVSSADNLRQFADRLAIESQTAGKRPAANAVKPDIGHRDIKPANMPKPARRGTGAGDPSLGGGERKILTALAQYKDGRTKQQVAILTGYAVNGGGFKNYVSSLRTRGLLEGSDHLTITVAGIQALGEYQPLPAGRALLEHWLGQLGRAEREVLKVLHEEWPNARPKEYVATKAGYEPDGGGFKNALSRLRTLELIEGKAKLKASDQLQDGAA